MVNRWWFAKLSPRQTFPLYSVVSRSQISQRFLAACTRFQRVAGPSPDPLFLLYWGKAIWLLEARLTLYRNYWEDKCQTKMILLWYIGTSLLWFVVLLINALQVIFSTYSKIVCLTFQHHCGGFVLFSLIHVITIYITKIKNWASVNMVQVCA